MTYNDQYMCTYIDINLKLTRLIREWSDFNIEHISKLLLRYFDSSCRLLVEWANNSILQIASMPPTYGGLCSMKGAYSRLPKMHLFTY